MRNGRPNLQKILVAWLAVIAAMLVAVLVTRDLALDRLAVDVTAGLRQCYSTGRVDHSVYTGGWKTPSLQGSAVYLIERGRRYPQMERELLITEALRSHDWIYLYSHCWNYDLRMLLIDRCKKRFPDDAEVAWASGRILLTSGHYAESVDEFERALDLGLKYGKPWIHEEHVRGRILTGLLMVGKVAQWESYLLGHATANLDDEGAAYRYINALLVQGKYDQALQEVEHRRAIFASPQGYSRLVARALFWRGRQSEFEEFIRAGKRDGTLDEKTKLWASNLANVKPPDVNATLLLEELEALTDRVAELDQQYEEVYGREGWQAARPISDQRHVVRKTELPFSTTLTQADYYAQSHDQSYIEPILGLLPGLDSIARRTDRYSGLFETHRIWVEANNYLGRSFVLAHEWEQLIGQYELYKEEDNYSTMKGSHKLLAVIASGKPLADGLASQRYYRGISIDPALFASAEFQSALAYGGRGYGEVMVEIQEHMQPFRDGYNDYSNGSLKIPWVRLAETDRHSWED